MTSVITCTHWHTDTLFTLKVRLFLSHNIMIIDRMFSLKVILRVQNAVEPDKPAGRVRQGGAIPTAG